MVKNVLIKRALGQSERYRYEHPPVIGEKKT